jgi:V8-like Glu-specific endopeptidase
MASAKKKPNDEKDKPILFSRWKTQIAAQPATKKISDLAIRVESIPMLQQTQRTEALEVSYSEGRADLIMRGATGQHIFAPPIETVALGRHIKRIEPGVIHEPFRPDHLALSAVPKKLPKELARPYFIPKFARRARKQWGEPTTVYSPDTRYTFSDTSYPWSCCGRVDTAAGWGSGVMVGPRHLLTASHVVNWGTNNTAGWLRFTPLYFDGGTPPFGVAWSTLIYSWNRANAADGINSVECAFDFVVCILDTRIGDITGWMGSRAYSTSWNGGSYWGHVGYPGDMAGGQRPAFHGFHFHCIYQWPGFFWDSPPQRCVARPIWRSLLRVVVWTSRTSRSIYPKCSELGRAYRAKYERWW